MVVRPTENDVRTGQTSLVTDRKGLRGWSHGRPYWSQGPPHCLHTLTTEGVYTDHKGPHSLRSDHKVLQVTRAIQKDLTI